MVMPPREGRGEARAEAWSVAALARALADALWARFGVVSVQGEISGFTRASSGHCYFALRDESAQLRCVMFRQRAALVDFDLRDGVQVELRAQIGLYEPRGDLQLQVESVRRFGQGALMEQFLRLKARLRAEGLFEAQRKRELPEVVRTVGIVTSPQAAALHDVLVTLRRRSPQVRVIVYPSSVQGAAAPAELVRALRAAQQRAEADVLLLVRGGGSLEDLWAFNDETLARALAQASIPVISGVGHETDFTIADFAADMRAPTPTAAAEMCAAPREELLEGLRRAARALAHAMQVRLGREQQRMDRLQLRLPPPARVLRDAGLQLRDLQARRRQALAAVLQRGAQRLQLGQARLRALPRQDLQRRAAVLDGLERRLRLGLARVPASQQQRLQGLQARLRALDPSATLRRGYCLAWRDDGSLLQDASTLRAGQSIVLATAAHAASLGLGEVRPVAHPLLAGGATEPPDCS
ncbi:MAG: exodeoxyribonuclease VII large subunit [Betaproteobacteria bacterium]|nr:exodeoxyribonuclease VII large subunit [Betaproteobacteria bacterium]MBU6513913.1 exodeoxyribonuclease VII large subunit [Betaproteobacteria bacterium]MDE1957267.1 exodeoxyribonuclease VII large subunit [Betaproteobacteria bacterium]